MLFCIGIKKSIHSHYIKSKRWIRHTYHLSEFLIIYQTLKVKQRHLQEGTTAAVENVDIDITDATKKNIFLNLLHYQLWGNRADLSLSSGVVENHININNNNNNNDDDDDNDNSVGSGKQAVDPSFVTTTTSTTTKAINKKKEQVSLLVDDSHSVWDMLMCNSKKQKKIIIVLDNCGLELLSDILCANSLLTNKICDIVELHCKSTPVFVSDALGKDIEQTITWLATKDLNHCQQVYEII